MHTAINDVGPGWNFDHSYSLLPEGLYQHQAPTAVAKPFTVVLNGPLAASLGLNFDGCSDEETAAALSGNALPPGAKPIAQAYAGHQFGHFTMLGDGRAILLGEHIAPDGRRFDIQLKGAGQTPYSRRGDGRATLRAMLREYLISEAVHHLGIPSSRSLAVVATGERVFREQVHAGAVLTRVMSSHIRVGTFEFARNFMTVPELRTFTEYVVQRHYPEAASAAKPALALLHAVMAKQAALVAEWMRVGFIHGVMNTDNMSIAGETFDYGPCAFMNAYDPRTVFSSIDTKGRYAYANQPHVAHWNLACLAGTLLPLLADDEAEATAMAQEALSAFPTLYQAQWQQAMSRKLGFTATGAPEKKLFQDLLQWMTDFKADYTNTFLFLQGDLSSQAELYTHPGFKAWTQEWTAALQAQGISMPEALATMRAANPCYIPRNHLVEAALDKACLESDFAPLDQLLQASQSPYTRQERFDPHQQVPQGADEGYCTFCGT